MTGLWPASLSPRSGAKGLLLAQHPVEGADGVFGAGLLLGFGLGQVGVEAGDRGVDVARWRVLFEKVGNFLHLGDPAIGFVVHPGDALAKAREHLGLAFG